MPERIRQLASACARFGIKALDAEVLCLAPETTEADIEETVRAAAEIGFRYVQTVIEDSNRNRAADTLGTLSLAASRAGIGVALEFMIFRPLATLAEATDLIDRVGSDNVGLIIDILHLYRSGGTPADIAALPAAKIALAPGQ